ncbi:MAG: DegT/DnrJ/EryC1/StrS family aminotransferase [Victivallales bacterium]|nr:DegT/DnrJ/EryC1/StrS family aminotransferase [Victivallales bacterium]
MSGTDKLALLGGPKTVKLADGDIFTWPIVTEEDEQAVLAVLRRGGMSGTDVTKQFEKEMAEWHGVEHALGFSSGTAALHSAMWACGVRRGDEIIVPGFTYWASGLPALNLGATVVFADIDPDTLCLDPNDIEHRITDRTKAIVPVHLSGYPADMDPIMEIAERHGLKVIEDVSHAHGGRYKGRLLGTIGHVGAFSLMSGKSFAVGEAGMFITDDRAIYERGLAFGHYGRHNELTLPELVAGAGMPWGGFKYRMHQLSAAVGRVQLKHYAARVTEIQKAMNHFWDAIGDVPGIKAHRPDPSNGSCIGGWYAARGLYRPEELGGLPVAKFCEAVKAEGTRAGMTGRRAIHLHPIFNDIDVYGDDAPTRIAFSDRDLRQPEGSLPVAEAFHERTVMIPWFKHYRPETIEQHAAAYRKVALNADQLR